MQTSTSPLGRLHTLPFLHCPLASAPLRPAQPSPSHCFCHTHRPYLIFPSICSLYKLYTAHPPRVSHFLGEQPAFQAFSCKTFYLFYLFYFLFFHLLSLFKFNVSLLLLLLFAFLFLSLFIFLFIFFLFVVLDFFSTFLFLFRLKYGR